MSRATSIQMKNDTYPVDFPVTRTLSLLNALGMFLAGAGFLALLIFGPTLTKAKGFSIAVVILAGLMIAAIRRKEIDSSPRVSKQTVASYSPESLLAIFPCDGVYAIEHRGATTAGITHTIISVRNGQVYKEGVDPKPVAEFFELLWAELYGDHFVVASLPTSRLSTFSVGSE